MCCGLSSSSSQTGSKAKRRTATQFSSTPYDKTTQGTAPVMYTAEKHTEGKPPTGDERPTTTAPHIAAYKRPFVVDHPKSRVLIRHYFVAMGSLG
ncbi:unnamed protein product [Fusarium equiseti]|uniref:Uncharacterized protein n=1 Tax=Fusarium equiseti TaxID=61235 RepID=A0A8J2NAA6_FUSEQ|nr:unnamed protein product [Fusarium equiseti]